MSQNNKISSVQKYVAVVMKKIQNLVDPDEVSNVWFRGENNGNVTTPLIPKLYRVYSDPNSKEAYNYAKNLENNIKSEFAIRSLPYLQKNNIEANKWNNYFLMQHYGLETRLLDWTDSALNALFFSIQDLSENDAKVWILNPHKLNQFTTRIIHPESKGLEGLINPSVADVSKLFNEEMEFDLNELARIYLDLDFDNYKEDKIDKFYPLAILPSILDERMDVQSSCFTIFGNQINGLKSIINQVEFLDSITISGTDKRSIREELRYLGISQKSIYPDLQGLSKSISDKYNSDHLILKMMKS